MPQIPIPSLIYLNEEPLREKSCKTQWNLIGKNSIFVDVKAEQQLKDVTCEDNGN